MSFAQFLGCCIERLRVNQQEILNWRWISQEAPEAEIGGYGAAKFTPVQA
jgi:hypothetical protein